MAKQDFAVRSGLIPRAQLFTPEELTELYRAAEHWFYEGPELDYKQQKAIQEARNKDRVHRPGSPEPVGAGPESGTTNVIYRSYAERGRGPYHVPSGRYGPRFLFSEQKKQVEEVLRVDPKNLNSYVGVVNQPPPKWSSVKKWLLHINYAPGYAPEPEQKPVCRQFSRCEGCPYPAHGFLCWGGEDDCMRTRVKKLNEKELEHEDQSGFV